MSPLCGDYDKLTGECITCSQVGYLPTINGCKRVTSPLASCQGLQALGYGECKGAEVNCKDYNLKTLECDKCLDGFEKYFNGKCEKKPSCGYRQWSTNGLCINYPTDCMAVDGLGWCTNCDPGFDRVQGQCVKTITCGSGFYKNDNNECVQVDPTCGRFNPSSGKCVTCKNGNHPNYGVCCPTGEIYSLASRGCVSLAAATNALNSATGSGCAAPHPRIP